MKRSSCFNGLLVIATLIMAQPVRARPLQRLDRPSPAMDSQDQLVRWRRNTRDIDDHLVRKRAYFLSPPIRGSRLDQFTSFPFVGGR